MVKKNRFSSLDFVDVDLKDPLTGGDGHIDCIKVYDNDDNISIELWYIFVFVAAFN